MKGVNTFLSEMRSSSSEEVAAMWARCEELYNKKLWHQLTIQLDILVKEPSMQTKLISIYTDFIADIEALCLCKVMVGRVRLHKLQQQKETKLIIEEVENLLDTCDGVSPVHSHFYLLASASDLHKIQGKHALFYRASL